MRDERNVNSKARCQIRSAHCEHLNHSVDSHMYTERLNALLRIDMDIEAQRDVATGSIQAPVPYLGDDISFAFHCWKGSRIRTTSEWMGASLWRPAIFSCS